ncbi:hypothetical protein [Novosphingobium sp. PhB165]|uniref:hypothetical protein n=1 Tax=Novosphingobium sp. PhB165 TaxID=2485105 RepID=UPI00104FB59A|nr:hypothetical protein [Novosphingobium sp. PhB165]
MSDDLVPTDPVAVMLEAELGVEETTDRILVAMKLGERKERPIILPEDSDDGLTWVSRTASGINSGDDSRFSVPDRITLLMPSPCLSSEGQILQASIRAASRACRNDATLPNMPKTIAHSSCFVRNSTTNLPRQ